MRTDTNAVNTVTVGTASTERDARILKQALTRCRRDVSIPLKDEYVRNLTKRIDNGRTKDCEHIVTVLRDAFERQAPRQDLEAFPRAILALIAEWCGDPQPDLPALLRLETEAQAVADLAEMDIAIEPTSKTVADAAERLRGHLVALERLVTGCERWQMRSVSQGTQRVA